jgi:hypothetical protein
LLNNGGGFLMRKFKVKITALLCIYMIINFSFGVFAADYDVDITLETITEATGGDGVRHSNESDWQSVTAPDGYYFNTNDILTQGSLEIDFNSDGTAPLYNDFIKITALSINGSENKYYMEGSDYVTVIPGITFPSTLKFKVYALGPTGHWTGRGWTTVQTQINYSKIP